MKTRSSIIYFAFVLMTFTTLVNAQTGWEDDGSVVRLESASDNVGIGTSSPTSKLQVVDGNSRFGTNPNYGQFSSEGNLQFFGDSRYFVSPNTPAFKAPASEIGLWFNAFDDRLEFRDADGNRMFSADIAGPTPGNGYFDADLSVVGAITATSFVGDGSQLTGLPSGLWTTSGSNIYYSTGYIGIGTTSPRAAVHTVTSGTDPNFIAAGGSTSDFVVPDGQSIEIGHYDGVSTFTERFKIDAAGNIGIGTSTPGSLLDVSGTVAAVSFVGDGSQLTGIQASSQWSNDGPDIYFNSGRVGVGISDPQQALHVSGGRIQLSTPGDDERYLAMRTDGGEIDLTANNADLYIGSNSGNTVLESLTGNVGVGISAPQHKLHVSGDRIQLSTPGDDDRYLAMRTDGGEIDLTANNADLYIGSNSGNTILESTSGNVGIGTTGPGQKLHVDVGASQDGLQISGSGSESLIRLYNSGAGGHNWSIASTSGGSAQGQGSFGIWDESTGGIGQSRLLIDSTGNVGIGTVNPTQKLTVKNGNIAVENAAGLQTIVMDGDDGGFGSCVALNNADGDKTLELDSDWAGTGDSRVVTDVLEITGGSDLAEPFDITGSSTPLPGMVVSINPDRPGELKIANAPYDRTVAGIISGAGGISPGMLMSKDGSEADGNHPVALTGRVYCLADASGGPIEPGDLLTTSDIPGHAMKVEDHSQAQGAIIGKAMTSLESGRGLIFVLVTLQ